jgi:hypothetical protein
MLAMNQRPFLGPCLSLPALLVMLLGASASAAEILSPGRLRERICDSPWEFSRLGDGAELARAKAYLGRAKAAGFTAVVFANTKWLALPSRAGAEYSARLKALGDEAARLGIGLVPMVTNFGDGAALLFHEPALAEGLPVRDALFVVRGRQAELQPDPPLELRNPGFEATDNGRPAGWTDEPGVTP